MYLWWKINERLNFSGTKESYDVHNEEKAIKHSKALIAILFLLIKKKKKESHFPLILNLHKKGKLGKLGKTLQLRRMMCFRVVTHKANNQSSILSQVFFKSTFNKNLHENLILFGNGRKNQGLQRDCNVSKGYSLVI